MQDYGFRDHYKKNMFVLQVGVDTNTGRGAVAPVQLVLMLREGKSGVMQ